MTWDTENNDDCNADTSGDVCGELAVGAWHTLIDHNFKDRNDGLGSGNLHRAGTNFKPVDEEAILRQRYKLPNPAKKQQNKPNAKDANTTNRNAHHKANSKYMQQPKATSSQRSNLQYTKAISTPSLTPSFSRRNTSESPETPAKATQQLGHAPARSSSAAFTNGNSPLTDQNPSRPSRLAAKQNNAWSQGTLISEPFWDKPKQQQVTGSSTANMTTNKAKPLPRPANTQPWPNGMGPTAVSESMSSQQRISEAMSMNRTMYDPEDANSDNKKRYNHRATCNSNSTDYDPNICVPVAACGPPGMGYNQNDCRYGESHNTTFANPTRNRHTAEGAMMNGQGLQHFQETERMTCHTSQPCLPQYQHVVSPPGLAGHTNPAYPNARGAKPPPGITPLPTFSNPVVAKLEVNLGPTIKDQVSIKMYDDSSILAERLCLAHNIYDPMVMKRLQMIFNMQQLAGIKKGLMR